MTDYEAIARCNGLPSAEAAKQRLEALEAQVDAMRCPHCGRIGNPDVEPVDNGTAIVYRASCPSCGRYIKWIPKSQIEGAKKPDGTRRKTSWTPASLGIEYCELCGRTKDRLGKNERLEPHHKIPVKDGGPDTKGNILILCTACHRMAHFLRTYLNEHQADDMVNDGTAEQHA